VGGGMVCAHCKQVGEIGTMKRCGRCHRVNYCSVACQKLHWKRGGHKAVCGAGSSSDTPHSGATGGGDGALKNPCPICLDTEDDAGESCMCFACGQLFCGGCKENLVRKRVIDCPTCRAVLGVSPAENLRRLQLLLARPAGRHTMYAQYKLGQCYTRGRGVASDDAEAARLYRLAADQGYADAQSLLGGVVESPRMMPKRYDCAVVLRTKGVRTRSGSSECSTRLDVGSKRTMQERHGGSVSLRTKEMCKRS
jgi:hypothetical protein